VGRAVGEQRTGYERTLVDRGLTDLTRPVGAVAQSFERAVDVVQRRFDCADALICELWHSHKLPGRERKPDSLFTQHQSRRRSSGHSSREGRDHVGENERTHDDEDDDEAGHARHGYRIDFVGEQDP
jgi:hypothetical protein